MAESILWLILGGALLLVGGEILVRGASGLARLFRIPSLIIGLTIVAACTGAPEMAVSLTGALQNNADIALGNVVGSNIVNILLVLGFSAMIFPIGVASRLIKREIPIMIFASALLVGFSFCTEQSADGVPVHIFARWAGFLFIGLYILYSIWVVRTVHEGEDSEITDDIQKKHGKASVQSAFFILIVNLLFLAGGLGLLVYGADMFIKSAITLAELCKISELVISLTVLAVGTSLPELVVSCVAALRGKSDIAIGNVIGSNTFNLLAILGLSSAISPTGIHIDTMAFMYDIPIMLGTAVLASVFCFTDKKLSRVEGFFLILFYVGYISFLVLRGST